MKPILPSIRYLLHKNGPRLSSDLSAILRELGASEANARKLIERRDSTVKRLEITFPHRAAFLYLAEQKDSDRYWENLLQAFRSTNSAFGYAIDALKVRGGIVPLEHFHIVSGSPMALKGHLSSETVLNKLIFIGAAELMPDPNWGSAVILKPHIPNIFDPLSWRARMIVEDITAVAVSNLIKRIGLGSHNKVEVRSATTAPKFGAFKWDITAPSYLAPLRQWRKGADGNGKLAHGFVVADILLGRELTVDDVRPFIRKNQIMQSQKNTRPFLSMLVAERFSPDALRLGKKPGFIMATTTALFSRDVAEALTELVSVMTYAAKAIVNDPELVYDIFQRLGNLEGLAGSMRGPLFELWVARYLSLQNWQIIGVGTQLRDARTTKRAEADVLASKNGESRYLACEAKGITSPVQKTAVEYWLTHQVPVIRAALLQRTTTGPALKMAFEFWTASRFSPESVNALRSAAKKARGYKIDWHDGEEILGLAKRSNDTYVVKLLNDFFIKNSATTFFETQKARKKRIARLAESSAQASEVSLPVSMPATMDSRTLSSLLDTNSSTGVSSK